MEKERLELKGKNKIDEGSSSASEPKTSEVEEYNPDDPLISGIPVPPAVGVSTATSSEESVEGISIFSP